MANVNFFLKEPTSDEETLIYLYFSYNKRRLKYSTGEKILVKFWNSENKRAKQTKKFPEYPEFNARLDNIEKEVKNAYRKILNDGEEPTNNKIKNELDKALRFSDTKEVKDLFSFIENYIKENESVKSGATIKTYKALQRNLKSYASEKNRRIDFEDIDLNFYDSFLGFLIGKGYSQNTIGKNIQILKTLLNAATDRGINKYFGYKHSKFKRLSEESDSIYLNLAELESIYKLNLSNDKPLEKVRDLFIVACFTGLRFSDFTKLKKENFNDGKIKIRTEKTDETVIIPQHKYVRAILKKYKNEIPEPLSNPKMNLLIKHIGLVAKIKTKIEVSITKGGKVEKEIKKKHELITTHTARRSFATNLYLQEIPTITIMKITGHKTERSFLKYIKISQEENANKLMNHPFFK